MSKRKILIIITMIILLFGGTGVLLTRDEKIEQIENVLTLEVGGELHILASDFLEVGSDAEQEVKIVENSVDVSKVGEYETVVKYKENKYDLVIIVEDTTAPKVEFDRRYIFTNDTVGCDINSMFISVVEYSTYTAKFVGFQKGDDIRFVDNSYLEGLEAQIPVPCDQEKLAELVSEEVPDKEGVYRGVIEVKDEHGNAWLEEIAVIYDITKAVIEDAGDKVVKVTKENLDKAPEVKPEDYNVVDNVDGKVKPEVKVEIKDDKKHEYTSTVTYTDRAGNEAEAEFKVTLEEATEKEVEEDKKAESNKNESNKNNTSSSNKNEGNKNNSSSSNKNESNKNNSSSNKNESSSNKNESSSGGTQPSESDIVDNYDKLNDTQKEVVDAGYYKVVASSNGSYYVIVKGDKEYSKGKELIKDYLEKLGYEVTNGCWGQWLESSSNTYLVGVSKGDYQKIQVDDDEVDW